MSRKTSGGAEPFSLRESDDYRLLQIFLGKKAVYEVYGHVETDELRCICPGFRLRGICKHVQFVSQRITSEGYTILIGEDVKKRDALRDASDLTADARRFREWAIHNTRIEVV